MILADKIMELRKKAGWSQEELAAQLGVSRQSVSKWEGAQSMPDMEKIVQLSRLFDVTTDYLLKDEIEELETPRGSFDASDGGSAVGTASATGNAAYGSGSTQTSGSLDAQPFRRVSMEEASEYIRLRKQSAAKIALATFLCIISPVCLIFLSALSQRQTGFAIREEIAAGMGLCILLVLVAIAVAIFISCGSKAKAYEFLDYEPFETAYGVRGMVREKLAEHQDEYTRLNIIGTVLCILSAVPLFAAMCLNGSDLMYAGAVCLLLFLVACGCFAFVSGGTYHGALMKLLEEGDYTRENKRKSKLLGKISAIYWLTVTAIFLFYTFGPYGNGQPEYSWFIWAVAGVLYGAVVAAVKLVRK